MVAPRFGGFRAKFRGTCGLCRSTYGPALGLVWRDPETGQVFHHGCAVRAWHRAVALERDAGRDHF
ncbi:MAG: hypothetical protein ACTHMW_16120 [Actinomycetes bacterium]